jgi:hypothetical protein
VDRGSQKIKPGTPMPMIEMSDRQREEIVDYLLSLAGTAPPPGSNRPTTSAPVEVYE